MRWLLLIGGLISVLVCAGCDRPETPAPEAVTAVYHCQAQSPTEEVSFPLVTRIEHGVMSVFLPPEHGGPYRRLLALDTAGTYGDDLIRLNVGERSADLELEKGAFPDCRYDHRASIWEHAKLGGADFRGVGNEPGWVLELREQSQVIFEYDYGATELTQPITAMQTDPQTRTTRIESGSGPGALVVTLIGESCADTMSDEVFETRVRVQLGERVFRGCGRALH